MSTESSLLDGLPAPSERRLAVRVTPDALRENADIRAETKRSVDEVIKTLPSLDLF